MSSGPAGGAPEGAPGIAVETRADGTMILRERAPLKTYPDKLTDCLAAGAFANPERTLVAARGPDGAWREISYHAMLATVRSIAAALGTRRLSVDRPIMILSGNDIEHLQLTLGAMWAGIPVAPVSPAYSLVSGDFARLKHLISLVTPGMVFAADGSAFARAIETCVPADVELVLTDGASATGVGRPVTAFSELTRHDPAQADALHAQVGPDTIAKFLFTSGSTKLPKAVPNTQRMLCSNQQMILQSFPVLGDEPPVLLDWLPWNHTFGGNHNVGIALYNRGTLYIDEGKPVASQFGKTLANLREIAPTVYFNVPKGFEDLALALESDAKLAKNFFSRLKFMFYAGAGLSQDAWDRIDRQSRLHSGSRVPMLSGIGMTETSPAALNTTGTKVKSGHVGVPAPGVEAKLAPVGGKHELRLRGPNIMAGYWRAPELSIDAFDEEGYYRTGDAVLPIDEKVPQLGLKFDGRLAEDFKLSSGTFVSVGPLRARIVAAAAPYVQDVVLAGINRDQIVALLFLRPDTCARLAETPVGATLAEMTGSATLRDYFQEVFDQLAAGATGSSTRVGAAYLLPDAPSLEGGEVTDKGSINQRAVLARRAALVDAIYDGSEPATIKPTPVQAG